jgi:hypothetical protein
LTIYCDDWNTEFTGNPTWDANVYTLTAANAPNFKYGTIKSAQTVTLAGTLGKYSLQSGLPNNNPNVYDLYLEAADLDLQLQTYLATPPTNNTVQDEYAAAEWLIFVNSGNASGLIGAINDSGSAFADAVYTDLSNAQLAVGDGFTAAGWDVIVPDDPYSMQEFMVDGFNGTTVPEPSAVILLGSIVGLLASKLFSASRRSPPFASSDGRKDGNAQARFDARRRCRLASLRLTIIHREGLSLEAGSNGSQHLLMSFLSRISNQ